MAEHLRLAAAAAGRQDEALATGRPAAGADAAEIVKGLACDLNADRIELPGFPDVVVRLHRALADPDIAAREVVRLVTSEPALAARLLKLANSAAFNKSGREISDLRMAITGLGFNNLRSQATVFAAKQMESQEWLASIRPLLADIWRTSNAVAALCFGVAKQTSGVQAVAADEAMSAGLFHLIGKLYLYARARQEGIDPQATADWEHALNDWHPTIARAILDHWQIPPAIAEAVEGQAAIFEVDNLDLDPLVRILCGARLHVGLHQPAGLSGEIDVEEATAALERISIHGRPFTELAAAARAEAETMRTAIS